jgi:hypothetical protein
MYPSTTAMRPPRILVHRRDWGNGQTFHPVIKTGGDPKGLYKKKPPQQDVL